MRDGLESVGGGLEGGVSGRFEPFASLPKTSYRRGGTELGVKHTVRRREELKVLLSR